MQMIIRLLLVALIGPALALAMIGLTLGLVVVVPIGVAIGALRYVLTGKHFDLDPLMEGTMSVSYWPLNQVMERL